MTAERAETSTELADLLQRLADEIEVLRETVDELRDELTYELRKLRDAISEPVRPFRLASMPSDACAPDFHARVNAVNHVPAPPNDEQPDQLLKRLMSEAATRQLTSDEWGEDVELVPDMVVEIDGSIFDWFAENLDVAHHGPEHFLADDGQGGSFLVWHRPEHCFIRLLTVAQRATLDVLVSMEEPAVSPVASLAGTRTPESPSPAPGQAAQQTLW